MCIIDKSGIQALFYFPLDTKFKPLDFLKENKVDLVFANTSLAEFTFQNYLKCTKTLFTGAEIVSNALSSKTVGESGDSFVICQTTGTVTLKQFDPSGFPLSSHVPIQEFSTLWDSSPFMLNTKNTIDRQTIISARNQQKNNKKVFMLIDDKGIIKQLKLELIKFLIPINILKWMVEDKFISRQKGVAIFKKWKLYNWTHDVKSFKDL